MVFVALGHKARSGKDTAVAHLIETYKDRFDIRRYAFADFLKIEFYDMLLEPSHHYWGSVGRAASVSYLALPHPVDTLYGAATRFKQDDGASKLKWIAEHRNELGNHLQLYGTEYVRRQDPFYWVRKLRDKLNEDQPQVALLADMRFLNELYFVKSQGGYVVKISREGYELTDGRDSSHESETQLDGYKYDFEINVLSGEVEQLKKDAECVFELILEDIALPALADVELGAAVLEPCAGAV